MFIATFTGNLGRDPEQKETKAGTVTNFSVAVTTAKDETLWVRCSAWGKTGDFVSEWFRKGSKIFVSGTLRENTYTKDGEEKRTLECSVSSAGFAGSKSDSEPRREDPPIEADDDVFNPDTAPTQVQFDESDLPF